MYALNGRAVEISPDSEEDALLAHGTFQSAFGLRFGTNRTLFGTIWFYYSQQLKLTSALRNRLELAVEHMALLYEQEIFYSQFRETLEYREKEQNVVKARQATLPSPQTCLPHLDISGWAAADCRMPMLGMGTGKIESQPLVSRHFYDWFMLPDLRMAIVAGAIGTSGYPESAKIVSAIVRSHAAHLCSVSELLQAIHRTLWVQSAAESDVSLFLGILDPFDKKAETQTIRYANIGTFQAFHLQRAAKSQGAAPAAMSAKPLFNSRAGDSQLLGNDAAFSCTESTVRLHKRDSLLVFSPGDGISISNADVAKVLGPYPEANAALQASVIRNLTTQSAHEQGLCQVDYAGVLLWNNNTPTKKR